MLSTKLNSKLSIRTGISITFFSCVFLILSALILFQISYNDELDEIDKNLHQLVKTIEHSARVAAYLENEELGREITNGLIIHDQVSGVILNSNAGMELITGDVNDLSGAFDFELKDPFTPSQAIGTLKLFPNQQLIETTAQDRALSHILVFGVNSILVILFVIILVNKLLAAPLKKIAQQLHIVKPGTSQRITPPLGHEHDEIGLLVDDSNNLLRQMQQTLLQKNELYDEVQKLEQKFRLIFDNAKVGIALINVDGSLVLNNPAFSHIIGEKKFNLLSNEQALNLIEVFEEQQTFAQAIQSALSEEKPYSVDLSIKNSEQESQYLHAILSQVIDETGTNLLELVIYDISERTKREMQTKHESEIDALTQLFNRRGSRRIIKSIILNKPELSLAVMLIDLDHFKPINDTYGHEAGDTVLKEISLRFKSTLRKTDLLSRWGGDEFLICLSGTPETIRQEARTVAEKILGLLGEEINLGDGQSATVGASIGIALSPDHGTDLRSLIKIADITMYRIKNQGKNDYLIYDE